MRTQIVWRRSKVVLECSGEEVTLFAFAPGVEKIRRIVKTSTWQGLRIVTEKHVENEFSKYTLNCNSEELIKTINCALDEEGEEIPEERQDGNWIYGLERKNIAEVCPLCGEIYVFEDGHPPGTMCPG